MYKSPGSATIRPRVRRPLARSPPTASRPWLCIFDTQRREISLLAFRPKPEATAPSGASESELCYLWDDGGEERLEIVDIRFVDACKGGMELLEAGGIGNRDSPFWSLAQPGESLTKRRLSVETLGGHFA